MMERIRYDWFRKVVKLEIHWNLKGLVMHKKKYATNILKRFNMMRCNPTSTPSEVNLKLLTNEDKCRNIYKCTYRLTNKDMFTLTSKVEVITMYVSQLLTNWKNNTSILFPKCYDSIKKNIINKTMFVIYL